MTSMILIMLINKQSNKSERISTCYLKTSVTLCHRFNQANVLSKNATRTPDYSTNKIKLAYYTVSQ